MTGTSAMGGLSGRPIRKFNPGTFQSDEEVTEQFVVRNRELGIVLDVLRGNIGSPSCQQVLIVGPRGRGKTMLLARVAAELRTNDQFSGRLLPVRFTEESQEIFDLADFWLETLFHLVRESMTDDPEIAQELRETHAALSARWGEQAIHEYAKAAVLDAADRLGRKLVLMVENLHSLCRNVDEDFGWKLRGALQSEPQIMLLASATSHFKGLADPEQPFFELFRVVELQPLATEECRCLWQVVTGDRVSGSEVRPLEILTGGNPRLLAIVAGSARYRSLRWLMEEVVALIDEHTEYFRGHLEVLPKSERRVYVAVIDLWQPSTAGEVAARARMDVRVVSTMLVRLVERGMVVPDPASSSRRRLYAAAEPLYSIYYRLRRERDESMVVRNLICFMATFYGVGESLKISETPGTQTQVDTTLSDKGMRQSRGLATMDAFRSAYAAFLPGKEVTMREVLRLVPDLIAAGAPATNLVEILSSDGTKAGPLAPLIVALRQHGGEFVRAPAEVREVAADIQKRIEETTAKAHMSNEGVPKGFV